METDVDWTRDPGTWNVQQVLTQDIFHQSFFHFLTVSYRKSHILSIHYYLPTKESRYEKAGENQ